MAPNGGHCKGSASRCNWDPAEPPHPPRNRHRTSPPSLCELNLGKGRDSSKLRSSLQPPSRMGIEEFEIASLLMPFLHKQLRHRQAVIAGSLCKTMHSALETHLQDGIYRESLLGTCLPLNFSKCPHCKRQTVMFRKSTTDNFKVCHCTSCKYKWKFV